MKTPDKFFKGRQQLNRYLYVKEIGEKLIKLQKDRCIIFGRDNFIVEGEFKLNSVFNDACRSVFYIQDGCTEISIIELSFCEDGNPYITTKKEIKEAFSEYFAVEPCNIKKIC